MRGPNISLKIIESVADFGSGSLTHTAETFIDCPWLSDFNVIFLDFVDISQTSAYESLVSDMKLSVFNRVSGVGFYVLCYAPVGCVGQVGFRVTII